MVHHNVLFLTALFILYTNATQIQQRQEETNKYTTAEGAVNLSTLNPGLILWEGDMWISKAALLTYYDFNFTGGDKILGELLGENVTTSNEKHKAVPANEVIRLWKDHTIRYVFLVSVSKSRRKEIREGMDRWERDTCLRFLPVIDNYTEDYVEVQDRGPGTSCGAAIGRVGGRQHISLPPHCTQGLLLHELGHVIGLFHEHTRPDRDRYVTMIRNELKLKELLIDSQGSIYDYRSVMHYPVDFGKPPNCKGNECITMIVNNQTEYKRQGSPRLGYFSLSEEDTKQVNRMYSCPQKGVRGFLSFQVKYGYSYYPQNTKWNPVVIFTIVDATGENYVKRTSRLLQASYFGHLIVWNDLVLVGYNEWQFFRMRMWNSDNDDLATVSMTTLLTGGSHRNLKHCENMACRGYIIYDYFLDTRTFKEADLVVVIRSARFHLQHGNEIGSYVRLEAVLSTGVLKVKTTKTIYHSTSPTWNEQISLGCGLWNSFFIQILGERTGRDVKLSDREWVWANPGLHSHLTHDAHKDGLLLYDYSLSTDASVCNTARI